MNIVKMNFGSHLYGTSTPESDIDRKGIFLPTLIECVNNNIPKSLSFSTGNDKTKNTKDDIDEEIFSLQYFIKLACEGQTVAIDMLHAPDEMIVEKTWIWDKIVKRKEKFYTKNLDAFVGYARKQAAKYSLKGSRLDTIDRTTQFLKQFDQDEKMKVVWDVIPMLEHMNKIENWTQKVEPENNIHMLQICGKMFQNTVKIGYVVENLEKFFNEYGERAKQARENVNIDWKAISHAVRAALQVKELLLTNNIIFPLKDAKLLKDIKQGKMSYKDEVAPLLESLMEECEELTKKSTLPSKVDRKYWENFIYEIYLVLLP